MELRIQRELERITARLPKYLSDNLMMRNPVDVEFENMNEDIKKSKHLNARGKRAIAYAERSLSKSNDMVVNPSIARQIDEYFDREVKRAIADGRLPKPEADKFIYERARKLREMGRA